MSSRKRKQLEWQNKLICGDNLEVLPTLEKESVDLIYIDPPFFSNRNYEIIWGDEAEIRSFEDRWEGGVEVYVDWMKQRVRLMYDLLKPTGSFYLHCDWHAGAQLRIMMDEIFGAQNFLNEIIWFHYGGGQSKRFFPRKHDSILFYKKGDEWTFNADDVRVPYESDYKATVFTRPKSRAPGKVYKPHPKGKVPEDVWIINRPYGKEVLPYPTQKPEALLERIIKVSSNKEDLVLDAFCGCGTTMAVAQRLDRRWIGIDISPSAISLVKNRLRKYGAREGKDMVVVGMPRRVEDLKRFKPYEFQYWAVNELHGTPSPKKAGDMGIDGLSFFHKHPLQVKQSEKVGRPEIDKFANAVRRYFGKTPRPRIGAMIAFSFTKGAYEEAARIKNKEGIILHLITVKDILEKRQYNGITFVAPSERGKQLTLE